MQKGKGDFEIQSGEATTACTYLPPYNIYFYILFYFNEYKF